MLMDFGQMTLDLKKETSRVGYKINTNKTKVLGLICCWPLPICINGSANDGTELKVAKHLNSAKSLSVLSKMWRCANINDNVFSLLLYETST